MVAQHTVHCQVHLQVQGAQAVFANFELSVGHGHGVEADLPSRCWPAVHVHVCEAHTVHMPGQVLAAHAGEHWSHCRPTHCIH